MDRKRRTKRTRTTATAAAGSASTSTFGVCRWFEENTMAILESSSTKDSCHIQDDRLCFLEAVRSFALAPASASMPSRKIYDAILQILTDGDSLEVAMLSYQLLMDLEKRFPRVCFSESDKTGSPSGAAGELFVVKEAWCPFVFSIDAVLSELEGKDRISHHLFDSLRFSILIEDIFQALGGCELELVKKLVKNMLLSKYLISVLEADFVSRKKLYKDTTEWVLIRESLLNIFLGSRKLNFRNFVRDCMCGIIKLHHQHVTINLKDLINNRNACPNTGLGCNFSVAITVPELEKQTCDALQTLFTLVMELDLAKKEADLRGSTTRLDGCRSPISDVILDELTYNRDQVSSFFSVFSEPKWKLEIIVQYFSNYCMKSSVRTRRSNQPSNETTLGAILSHLSSSFNAKIIAKKVTSEVVRLLLIHAFQASLSLLHGPKHITNSTEKVGGALQEICYGLISSFKILRELDKLDCIRNDVSSGVTVRPGGRAEKPRGQAERASCDVVSISWWGGSRLAAGWLGDAGWWRYIWMANI